MKILIAGAGSVGRSIAQELISREHSVTLVDFDSRAMRISQVPKANWVLADACEVSTLQNIELNSFDVVVAATGDDKANLVLALLAKTEFGVPKVLGRVNNPSNEWLFNDSWGVDFAVSTPRIMTMMIENAMASGDLKKISEFDNGESAIYQTVVSPESLMVGKTIAEITLPASFFISAIVRDGVPLQAENMMQIMPADRLIILGYQATENHASEVSALFSAPR